MISHPDGQMVFQVFSQLLIVGPLFFSHLLIGGPDPEAYFDGAAQKSNRCEKWEGFRHGKLDPLDRKILLHDPQVY